MIRFHGYDLWYHSMVMIHWLTFSNLDMDVDGAATTKSSSTSRRPKKEIRVQKAHRRVRNELVFRKRVFKKTKGGPGKSNR
jgi:hypothetical protein